MRLKKNDNVLVIAGKEKGKTGRILKIDYESERAYVQGLNMVKKTMKRRKENESSSIKEIEAPIHISNLSYVLKGQRTKIGYKMEKGSKVRYAKKTGDVL